MGETCGSPIAKKPGILDAFGGRKAGDEGKYIHKMKLHSAGKNTLRLEKTLADIWFR
jgi:hypothetical protein